MSDLFKHKQVNWQDGMKIDRSHFLDADFFHLEQQTLSRSLILHENNFGLLPYKDKKNPSNDVSLILEGDTIKIDSFRIAVLMLNGMLININSDELESKNFELNRVNTKFNYKEIGDKEFFLLFKTNSFEGFGYGSYDSEELPLRRPYLIPSFEFSLLPENQVKDSYFGDDFILHTKLKVENNEIVANKEYIPPVTSLLSSEILELYHQYVYKVFNLLELNLIEIARKYGNMKAESFRDTLLLLSQNLLNALSRIKFELKHKLLYEPPVNLIMKIKEIANILNYTLSIRTSLGKDKFLSEVNKILGLSKFDFEEMMKKVVNLEYRHYDIQHSVNETKYFLDHISTIFKSLSEYEKSKRSFDVTIKR